MSYMFLPLKRYFDFSGRSRRKEFWLFFLLQILLYAVLLFALAASASSLDATAAGAGDPQAAAAFAGLGLTAIVPVLLLIIPNIAVTVRRFHDQDKSGWMYLINFIPLVGGIIVLVFMCMEGTRGPNTYGRDPKNPLDVGDTFA